MTITEYSDHFVNLNKRAIVRYINYRKKLCLKTDFSNLKNRLKFLKFNNRFRLASWTCLTIRKIQPIDKYFYMKSVNWQTCCYKEGNNIIYFIQPYSMLNGKLLSETFINPILFLQELTKYLEIFWPSRICFSKNITFLATFFLSRKILESREFFVNSILVNILKN